MVHALNLTETQTNWIVMKYVFYWNKNYNRSYNTYLLIHIFVSNVHTILGLFLTWNTVSQTVNSILSVMNIKYTI